MSFSRQYHLLTVQINTFRPAEFTLLRASVSNLVERFVVGLPLQSTKIFIFTRIQTHSRPPCVCVCGVCECVSVCVCECVVCVSLCV